jgi:hypothetical protein
MFVYDYIIIGENLKESLSNVHIGCHENLGSIGGIKLSCITKLLYICQSVWAAVTNTIPHTGRLIINNKNLFLTILPCEKSKVTVAAYSESSKGLLSQR